MVGDGTHIPPEAIAELERGSKIGAIKLVRLAGNLDLKDAKDRVDAFLETNPVLKERCEAAGKGGCLRPFSFLVLVAAGICLWLFR